jgi:hypothetical protein
MSLQIAGVLKQILPDNYYANIFLISTAWQFLWPKNEENPRPRSKYLEENIYRFVSKLYRHYEKRCRHFGKSFGTDQRVDTRDIPEKGHRIGR